MTVRVSRKAWLKICHPSTARVITLTALIKVHWLLLGLRGNKRKTNPGSSGTRRQGHAAGQALLKNRDKMEQGRDYFIQFLMHLFQPDDEDSLKRQTPHL